MPRATILLASASPRAPAEILQAAGLRFRVVAAPEVEELGEGDPARLALTNARRKARAALRATPPGPGEVLLGADTVVVHQGRPLGKPSSRAEAGRMLRALSGGEHRVVTGICLLDGAGGEAQSRSTTRVRFAPLAASFIRGYLGSGEADDKAGAYGIQGRVAPYVTGITGCYFNVVGLSPAAVRRALGRLTGRAEAFLCGPDEY